MICRVCHLQPRSSYDGGKSAVMSDAIAVRSMMPWPFSACSWRLCGYMHGAARCYSAGSWLGKSPICNQNSESSIRKPVRIGIPYSLTCNLIWEIVIMFQSCTGTTYYIYGRPVTHRIYNYIYIHCSVQTPAPGQERQHRARRSTAPTRHTATLSLG